MPTSDKLELLREWYRRVWIEADLDAIDDYFAPQAAADGLMPDGQVGAEDFRALVPALLALVRDLRIEVVKSVESDDWLWAQIVATGRSATSDNPIRAHGQVMVRISAGKIVEAYNCFDFITFFEQAGLLPKDAFLLLLSSERLG
ncbi:SnoaL-like polyketide cyclase [Albidovulum inexpectatum]|uniref:SnoaL-like polyketide cyclase n=1 Tax=Albidovulum inexpectatum TaxID=196587 RepID=A0A2S5JEV8_9RHOB|nr:nuclear transport factor 2 family protein [Albidovulum inexpectatum]PPB80046.1 SnoaL-like polyketide cyclase [Albidovulum inexpectatum]